jgi:glutamate-1-semialdehyde 2,1-aminomutase
MNKPASGSARPARRTLDLNDRAGSMKWFMRAVDVTPGGVHSPVRAFRSVQGTPVYFAEADGAFFVDVDGGRYVDFCMSWGPLILGHSHPDVVAAVRDAAGKGLSYGATHPGEVELSELIAGAFEHFDQVRLVSSGTEAVMTAIRIARGATGRPFIVKLEGGYHGHSDGLLVKAGSGLVTSTAGTDTEPSSAGIPPDVAGTTLVAPLNDLDAIRALFDKHGEDIAALIIEPVPANNGLLVQSTAYLRALREITTAHGALLIFDEVITGFRLGFGGYGESVGIAADLVTLGKIVGGGLPVGAIVGPKALMEKLAPVGPVYQAGTLSGNPLSCAAGKATLQALLDGEVYARVDALGAHLQRRVEGAGQKWPQIKRCGSIAWLYFDDAPMPLAADGVSQVHVRRFNALHGKLLDEGYYLPPSAFEVLFLSAAHSQNLLDGFVDTLLQLCTDLD